MLFCSHCGIMVGEEYDLCPKCDGSLTPSASGDELGQYAGLWIRLAAGLIDALILGVALLMEFAFASLMGMGQDDGWVGIGVFWGAFALVCLSYEVGMTRSRRRGTLGKRALGLMVTDRSGDRISLGRSISRAVAKLLLSALSFTVVAFRRRKTALHDQIARTEVARGPRSSSMAAWSMAMGLLSLLLSVPAGIPAIIMGHISRARLRKSGGGLQGDGEARAGLILGYASIAIFPLLFAVPQFVKMQAAVVEADPVGEMRVLNTAMGTYKAVFHTYPPSLQALGPRSSTKIADAVVTGWVDSSLAGGLKSGYRYSYERVPADQNGGQEGYKIHADPISADADRHFYSDQTGAIRSEAGQPASPSSGALH